MPNGGGKLPASACAIGGSVEAKLVKLRYLPASIFPGTATKAGIPYRWLHVDGIGFRLLPETVDSMN